MKRDKGELALICDRAILSLQAVEGWREEGGAFLWMFFL